MNLKRYTIAGSLSLAIHAAVVFVAQEPKAFAMPAGAQSNSVSINFKALTAPAESELPKAINEPQHQAEVEPAPEPNERLEKAEAIEKTKPRTKKVAKDTPKVEKKATKAPSKPHPVTAKKTQPEQVSAVRHEPKRTAQPEFQAQPEVVNQGASSQPVMVTKPSFLTRPSAPRYPRLAQRRGVEGVALYEIWLDENGKQVKQVLISSSGASMLDNSALEAIKKWQFSPHSVDGQKMAHRVQIPVRFKLDR